jgi:hypothetical protein
MKICFCDFDGVLRIGDKFSPSAIKNLNRLLKKEPDLKIVVSSSWRHRGLKFCKGMLEKQGVDSERVVDTTDGAKRNNRGHHIERWIKDHKPEAFVILDNKADMDKVLDHLVQTNSFIGLTESDVKKSLDILKKTK